MAANAREEKPMTAIAEPEVIIQKISAHVPVGYLTAADLPHIDLEDVSFEIQDGALSLMPPPSIWHDATANGVRKLLAPRHAHVGADLDLVIGENLRRPDLLGLSVSLRDLLLAKATKPTLDIIEVAVEIISHDIDRSRDRISVRRDRETKFHEYAAAGIPEYWIVDEVLDDPMDASVEMYQLKDGAYVPIRVARLSELLSEAGNRL
jgi:Uma2 family endonuclease